MGEYKIIQSENCMAKFKNAKLLIFENVLNEIKKRKQKNRAFILGINGIDGSGKTEFAKSFKKFLLLNRHKAQIINMDDFFNPKEERYSGNNQVYNYFHKSFNIDILINELLMPISKGKCFRKKLTLLNIKTNKYNIRKEYILENDTVVIFEGIFLFRKELLNFIDYKIFLEISFQESMKRMKNRDIPIYGNIMLEKISNKIFPAQKKYLRIYLPFLKADILIDNTNWDFPKIKTSSDYK